MRYLLILSLLFACSKTEYQPNIVPSNETKDQMIDKLIEFNRKNLDKFDQKPPEGASDEQVEMMAKMKIESQKKLNEFDSFLRSSKFNKQEIQTILQVIDENMDGKFFNKGNLQLQLKASELATFIQEKAYDKMDSEKKKFISAIAEAAQYNKNIEKTFQRFKKLVDKIPVPKEQKDAMFDKQKESLKYAIFFAHKDEDVKELAKWHYYLTYPAYLKYKKFWQSFLEDQMELYFKQMDKTFNKVPSK